MRYVDKALAVYMCTKEWQRMRRRPSSNEIILLAPMQTKWQFPNVLTAPKQNGKSTMQRYVDARIM